MEIYIESYLALFWYLHNIVYSKTCLQGTLAVWFRGHFFRTRSYLPHVKEPVMKGQLSWLIGTLSWSWRLVLLHLYANGKNVLYDYVWKHDWEVASICTKPKAKADPGFFNRGGGICCLRHEHLHHSLNLLFPGIIVNKYLHTILVGVERDQILDPLEIRYQTPPPPPQ